MSVTGFMVDGQIQKYDYDSLDNLPDIPENSGTFWATYNSTSEAEITDAFSNNKSVMMKYGNDIFSVMRKLSIGPSGSAWLFVSVGQTNIRTTWVSGSYWNSFSTNTMGGEISNNLKQALLQLASKIAYIDEYGQTYYNDLYDALYPKELISISATFNQGSNIIYDIDPLTVLNQYLTVVANYSNGTTETIPSSNYTLSGNLLEGVSTITVYYEGFTDTFNVNVTHMAGYYTIVNNLTGCTTNNSATAIQENTSYTAIITASAGYTLSGATVTITMGGNILTGVFSNGTISIPNVTGNLVITVVASAVTLSSITAVYTQSGTVYDTDTLDSLKADLVVTAVYSDSSTQTVPAADYTLSGTLTAGTSTITVSYGGKTTTFNVTVTQYVPEYVTSGLVHKWDAIDNTASGHDSSATVWKDLVGSCDLTLNYPSAVTWESNAISFNPTTSTTLQTLSNANGITDSTNMTIEMVMRPIGSNANESWTNSKPAMVASFIDYSSNNSRRFGLSAGDVSVGVMSKAQFYSTGLNSLLDIRSIVGTYTSQSAPSGCYVNAVALSSRVSHSYSGNVSGVLVGGFGSGTNLYPYLGKIYAIRIYNRVLSAEEIAQNYQADVVRFGLGG